MKIAFLNLTTQYQSLKDEIDSAIQQVLTTGPLVGGTFVKTFEKSFTDYHGVKHCISTGNGTDSLFAALKMSGVGAGDEVITPAWSWISTSETISLMGANLFLQMWMPVHAHFQLKRYKEKSHPKQKPS